MLKPTLKGIHPVIIKFSTRRMKDAVYYNKKLLKDVDGMGSVFISEDLTHLRYRTLILAKKVKNLSSITTRGGKIKVYVGESRVPVTVESPMDLLKLDIEPDLKFLGLPEWGVLFEKCKTSLPVKPNRKDVIKPSLGSCQLVPVACVKTAESKEASYGEKQYKDRVSLKHYTSESLLNIRLKCNNILPNDLIFSPTKHHKIFNFIKAPQNNFAFTDLSNFCKNQTKKLETHL